MALEREGSNGETDADMNYINGGGSAVSQSQDHGMEQIGWMAFQHGKGSIGGDLYQASITESVVTDNPSTGGIAFCAGFTDPPLFFSNMATHHGGDSAEVRLSRGVTADDAAVFIEEESCTDDETTHLEEVVAYFAFQRDSAHKIRARTQAPANVPPVSEAVVCDNSAAGPAELCCGDMTMQVCIDCWNRQGVPPPTGTSCTERATTTFNAMNDVCCSGKKGCDTGAFPTSCSADCAGLWMPIWQDCGAMVEQMFATAPQMASSIGRFSDACEARFLGSGSGRCDDDYWHAGLQMILQKCGIGQPQESRQHLQGSFPETCETDCKRIFEPFYEEYDQKAPLAPLTR